VSGPVRLPPEITTVLFDMDGVLIDTGAAVRDAYTDWAKANGLDPEDVLSIVHGRRTVEVARHFGLDDELEAEADRIEKAIADRASVENAIVPTCELYRSLDPGRFAVATSARRDTAATNLRVLGLDQPRVLVTGQDVKDGKPSPDPYLLAAERLGADPAECVVVEDAPAGIRAGKSAGAFVVALTTTHQAPELEAADLVLEPAQLEQTFQGLRK
jgi:sugar-phosphatase